MDRILNEPLTEYLIVKKELLKDNQFAKKFTSEFKEIIENAISDKHYIVKNSVGNGNWANCPWIAIFDPLVTKTAQEGYYLVYLFCEDMSGVYLSINQGITEVAKTYKKNKKDILRIRANNYRAKIDMLEAYNHTEIDLKISNNNSDSKLYEFGNIYSKFYSKESIPAKEEIIKDLNYFLDKYKELVYNDNEEIYEDEKKGFFEKKQLKYHYRIERNSNLAKQVKKIKGYKCECCSFKFSDKYKHLGEKFIEAHHLYPISKLDFGYHRIDPEKDFAVLCSNCHRMIHKLDDPSDLSGLKRMINQK